MLRNLQNALIMKKNHLYILSGILLGVLVFSVLQITMASPSIPNPGHGTSQLEGDGDLNMNSHKIINVLTPIASGDAATKGYADALGSGGGCAGGLCDSLPVGYDISYDWDGDGKNMTNGDCDETCSTCYGGSPYSTTSPDNKDQNCNGEIDEYVGSVNNSKSCSSWGGRRPSYSAMQSSCASRCALVGATMTNFSCTVYNSYAEYYSTINWDSCSASGGDGYTTATNSCHPSNAVICTCSVVDQYK